MDNNKNNGGHKSSSLGALWIRVGRAGLTVRNLLDTTRRGGDGGRRLRREIEKYKKEKDKKKKKTPNIIIIGPTTGWPPDVVCDNHYSTHMHNELLCIYGLFAHVNWHVLRTFFFFFAAQPPKKTRPGGDRRLLRFLFLKLAESDRRTQQ